MSLPPSWLPVSLVVGSVQVEHAPRVVLLLGAQVRHADVAVRVIAHKVAVVLHIPVDAVYQVHALLVRHRQAGLRDDRLQFVEHPAAFLQHLRVARSDGGQLVRRIVPVGEHLLERVHVDVRYFAHEQHGLLHLAGILHQVVYGFECVVILLPLFVNLDRFLKVLHHVLGGRGGLYHVPRGVHDALCEVRRVKGDPLRPDRRGGAEQCRKADGCCSFHCCC